MRSHTSFFAFPLLFYLKMASFWVRSHTSVYIFSTIPLGKANVKEACVMLSAIERAICRWMLGWKPLDAAVDLLRSWYIMSGHHASKAFRFSYSVIYFKIVMLILTIQRNVFLLFEQCNIWNPILCMKILGRVFWTTLKLIFNLSTEN